LWRTVREWKKLCQADGGVAEIAEEGLIVLTGEGKEMVPETRDEMVNI
jgi:hypothetical protein